MVLRNCDTSAECGAYELCDFTHTCTPCDQVYCDESYIRRQGSSRLCMEKCPDYFKDKIQGLTTTLTTHMTSQEATSLGVPEEAEIGVWRVILITAVVLVLMGAFALLVWRRRVLQKRRHKTQNGPAGKLKLPIEAHCTSDNEQHSPTDDSHTQQLVISNQGNQTSMV